MTNNQELLNSTYVLEQEYLDKLYQIEVQELTEGYSEVLNEAATDTIIEYLNKTTARIQEVWNKFKAKILSDEDKRTLGNYQDYFNTGFELKMPAGTELVDIDEFLAVLGIKIPEFQADKIDLDHPEEFIKTVYPHLYIADGEKHKSPIEVANNKVFFKVEKDGTTISGKTNGKIESIPTYKTNFIDHYKDRVNTIASDIKNLNTAYSKIVDYVKNQPSTTEDKVTPSNTPSTNAPTQTTTVTNQTNVTGTPNTVQTGESAIFYEYMSSAVRKGLPDSEFGLPEDRKYPLDTEARVRSAIKFFNKCDSNKEKELARNIKKAIKKFNIKVNVGKENRFSNYYTESAIYEAEENNKATFSNLNQTGNENKPKANTEILKKVNIYIRTCNDILSAKMSITDRSRRDVLFILKQYGEQQAKKKGTDKAPKVNTTGNTVNNKVLNPIK